MTWSVPEQSRTSCQVLVRFAGSSATGMSSIRRPKSSLVELMREVELLEAPARSEPNVRDKEQYRFAARGRFVESALPPFSCRYAAVRINIKKNIFPAFTLQPIAKCNCLGIVLA